jgi:hypothetical protein
MYRLMKTGRFKELPIGTCFTDSMDIVYMKVEQKSIYYESFVVVISGPRRGQAIHFSGMGKIREMKSNEMKLL